MFLDTPVALFLAGSGRVADAILIVTREGIGER
jgi:hypothetical protein